LTAVIIAKTLEFPGLAPQNARFEPLSEGLFSSANGPSLRREWASSSARQL